MQKPGGFFFGARGGGVENLVVYTLLYLHPQLVFQETSKISLKFVCVNFIWGHLAKRVSSHQAFGQRIYKLKYSGKLELLVMNFKA